MDRTIFQFLHFVHEITTTGFRSKYVVFIEIKYRLKRVCRDKGGSFYTFYEPDMAKLIVTIYSTFNTRVKYARRFYVSYRYVTDLRYMRYTARYSVRTK